MAKAKEPELGFDPADMKRRALAAWYRGGEQDQPNDSDSGWEEQNGLHYIVLRNNLRLVLAVYRIRGDGSLKRMRRPPKSIAP